MHDTTYYESLQNAADRTGFSVQTLRRRITEGTLPAYRMSPKPGSSIRVRRADVDALLTLVIPSEVYAG